IEDRKFSKVVVNGLTLELTERAASGETAKVYSKRISAMWMSDLLEILRQAEQDQKIDSFDYTEPTNVAEWINIALILVMIVGMGAFIWFTYSRQSGDGKNAMSFGRSRAKLNDPTKNKITFADVAGADEEKEELRESVDFLKNPKK